MLGEDERLDRNESKEVERVINKQRRAKAIIHSLMHPRCQFCAHSFNSANCRNCCLPICQEFNKIGTRKYVRNQLKLGPLVNSRSDGNLKKYTGSRLGLATTSATLAGDLISETPSRTSSPAPSIRAFSSTGVFRPTTTASGTNQPSTTSTATVATEADNPNNTATNKMNDPSPTENSQLAGNSERESGVTGDEIAPSAPFLGHELFNNEDQSDVVFLVGIDPDKEWRFPAHTSIICNASSVFKSFCENVDPNSVSGKPKEIKITVCDPTTFHTILKYIYTNEVTLKSVTHALEIFHATVKFALLSLASLCLTFLHNESTNENVLEILTSFYGYFRQFYDIRTAGNLEVVNAASDLITRLIYHCFAVVDQYAGKVITSEEFANLDHEMASMIVSRSTLRVQNELEVFTAITNWACQQCKVQRKELTDENKRNLLGEMLYSVRYLTLTLDEFKKGPYSSNLLTTEEKNAILKTLITDRVVLPKHMQSYNLSMKRRYRNIESPLWEDEEDSGNESLSSDAESEEARPPPKLSKYEKKKRSATRRFLKRMGDFMILIIQVLD